MINSRKKSRIVLLELNEINFEFVERYADTGLLPNLRASIDRYGITRTVSEAEYAHLEPWIQWVSAHTGKRFHEHEIFRLGDIVHADIEQIWEKLEKDKALKVAAVSPMNASNKTQSAAFFVPDPWTATEVTGPPSLKLLYRAVRQLVNDNAQGRITAGSVAGLLIGLVRYSQLKSLPWYLKFVVRAAGRPWNKALVLDRLLADVFVRQWRVHRPDFSSLFLNAGAHIQHHYMFSSAAYQGTERNPEWYVSPDHDPVLDVYQLYDQIVGEVFSLDDVRVLIATGLHQDPYEEATYYYRLRDHERFLEDRGIAFQRVEPRMSRDFLVHCASDADARSAEDALLDMRAADGIALFEVDNRGSDLFVTLTYPREIAQDFEFTSGGKRVRGLHENVAFVAIKNGEHNGLGYLIDTGSPARAQNADVPLTELFSRVVSAFD